jgi:hypothetical protein
LNDKSLGSVILVLGVMGVMAYVYWFLAPATPDNSFFYVPALGLRWALVLPVLLAVVGLFAVAIWIGWTMVITPAPIPKREGGDNGKNEKS